MGPPRRLFLKIAKMSSTFETAKKKKYEEWKKTRAESAKK